MLNDTKCRAAKAKEAPYKLPDAQGLYLEVRPSGAKLWRYRFKLVREGERKESTFAIGEYATAPAGETAEERDARRAGGRFTLAEARAERAKARALVKQGVNPAQARQLERVKREIDGRSTVVQVAREWVETKQWEPITKARRLAMLARVVFPRIGELPVKQVTPHHCLDVLTTARTANGPSVAAEAQRTLAGIFDFAVSTLRADANPVYPVRKALPANKTQHKRPLMKDEIGDLFRALREYPGRHETMAAFRLMWLTLCRPNEAVGARWSEFDLDAALWRIPAERMKKRREHVVPLPKQAVELLRAMQPITGRFELVFPGRDDRRKPITDSAFRQMLIQVGWSGRFSPHAARTTGSTHLNDMGFAPDWVERQLAHADPNTVRRTYNHAEHLADRAKMMQSWADCLDVWERGGEIVPLRAKGAA